MTLEEYDSQMENLVDAAYMSGDFNPVGDFQQEHMIDFLNELRNKAETDIEKEAIEILVYLIGQSQSGSVVSYMDTEEKANELADYLNEHEFYGEIMLDAPQIYESNGKWAVDCMFGGNYCPFWDGWEEAGDRYY